jgi:hypothetical protein
MQNESLSEVKTAFEEWRSKKRHAREAIPAALLEMARQAARRFGPTAVTRVAKVDRRRLKSARGTMRGVTRLSEVPARVPVFSRVELLAPTSAQPPFAEVELPTGLKLRLFAQSEATLALLGSLCGAGGAQ